MPYWCQKCAFYGPIAQEKKGHGTIKQPCPFAKEPNLDDLDQFKTVRFNARKHLLEQGLITEQGVKK